MKKHLLFLTIFLSGNVYGQKIITDRPDQTESSSTIPKGSLQIEGGFLIGFTEENTQSQRQILAPTTLFRYGLTKWLEIRLLNQLEESKNQAKEKGTFGISDLEVGTKIQFLRKEDLNIEIAFLSHIITPTGSNGLSNKKFGTINKLSLSHELSEKLGIGYNLGYNYFGSGIGDFTYSIVLGIGVTKKVSIYIEPYGDLIEFKNIIANIDAGLTYLLRDNFQLDFSFGTGINYTMNYISIGFSWNISKKKTDNS